MSKKKTRMSYKDIEKLEEDYDLHILDIVKEYYNSHFPVDVTTWVYANVPSDNMIHKDDFSEQVSFVRDILTPMLLDDRHVHNGEYPKVISTHSSKSIRLPVFMIDVKKLNLSLILRCNFYDWKVSVISQKAIKNDFGGLFEADEKAEFCEGFPEEFIFGTILEDSHKFTIEINNTYNVYAFCFLLKKQLLES